jgi:hypothetical protein
MILCINAREQFPGILFFEALDQTPVYIRSAAVNFTNAGLKIFKM